MKLCTAAWMREIDRRTVEEFGIPSLLLMENAGRAVALRALALLAERGSGGDVWAVCGKGNNGGDGFVAARHLHQRGVRVRCWLAGDPTGLQGDARRNFEIAERLGIAVRPVGEMPTDGPPPALLLDALLGTGFRGEPSGDAAEGIRRLSAWSGIPVLAVDLPSGLNADTGNPAELCVRATETVTFGLPKVGLVSEPGRGYVGSLTVAEIGLPAALLEAPVKGGAAEWITAAEARPLWPARPWDAHKGRSGRLFVLAGSTGLTGAAAMTCDAALRAGAGLVTLGIPARLNPILETKLTEAMTLPLPETETGAHSPESIETIRRQLDRADALAAGPGFGREPRSAELLRALLAECRLPVVIDGDGLTLLAPADGRTFPAHSVVTPHPGEMARLLGTEIAEIQSDRLGIAKKAAERFGCVVVLKGAVTLIAAPDGRLAVNSSGHPALASGGTGDVLTGLVGAALARGLAPFEAAVAAVYLHGIAGEMAGERFGAPGAVAGDVIAAIPEALRRLRAGEIPPPCRTI